MIAKPARRRPCCWSGDLRPASGSPEGPVAEHERCGHAVRIWTVVDGPRVIAWITARRRPHHVAGSRVSSHIENRDPRRGLRYRHPLRSGSARQAGGKRDGNGQCDPSRHHGPHEATALFAGAGIELVSPGASSSSHAARSRCRSAGTPAHRWRCKRGLRRDPDCSGDRHRPGCNRA